MDSTEIGSEVVVVGAGVGGIATAIKLKEAGITDFVVLERESGVGGTWYTQRYPGLTVDVPSLTYSFSFEQKPDWSSIWATQPEVLAYCEHCVDKYDVRDHFRFSQRVEQASHDEEANEWTTVLDDGTQYRSRYLINASGYLSQPKWPDIAGIDRFEGIKVHTSRWEDGIDLAGKRVAFIGTGATAIQLAPQIADRVEQMHVFQRTPIWLLPKPPLRLNPNVQRAFANVPGLQRLARTSIAAFMDLVFFRVFNDYRRMGWFGRGAEKLCRRHIRRSVDDPQTQKQLVPKYSWGCKRPSFSNDFYPMFNKPQVGLVTSGIDHVTEDAIVTADGQRRPIDVLVCATGYQPFERSALPTYPVRGRGGQELTEYWETNRYQAFRGFAVHGFPNYFLIFGPYSIASSSYIAAVELAVRNVVNCIRRAHQQDANYVEVRAEAQRAEFEELLSRKPASIWAAGNCGGSKSYYVDRHGDTPTFRPSTHPAEWWAARQADLEPFEIRHVESQAAVPAGR
jgi:cation diffusion facilitator CzcD-associated flavoprotein CzcO